MKYRSEVTFMYECLVVDGWCMKVCCLDRVHYCIIDLKNDRLIHIVRINGLVWFTVGIDVENLPA